MSGTLLVNLTSLIIGIIFSSVVYLQKLGSWK